MDFPEDLKYDANHEWVSADGSHIKMGISDYAQDALGDIVFVELPEVGRVRKIVHAPPEGRGRGERLPLRLYRWHVLQSSEGLMLNCSRTRAPIVRRSSAGVQAMLVISSRGRSLGSGSR